MVTPPVNQTEHFTSILPVYSLLRLCRAKGSALECKVDLP